jgi:hypothetical protein
MGMCKDVRWVALDPPPGAEKEGIVELFVSPREAFLESLLGRESPWFEGKRSGRQRSSTPLGGVRSHIASKMLVRYQNHALSLRFKYESFGRI